MVDAARTARRRVGRPTGADSAETREVLLRAAVEAFAETGLARTTLRQVADAAGLTTGTLYHHYATKEALYIAAFMSAVDQLYAEYDDAIAGVDTLRGRLLATLERTRLVAKRSPATLHLIVRAWVEHQDVNGEPMPPSASAIRFVQRIVDDAHRAGEIDRTDRRQVSDVFRAVGWGTIAIGLTGGDHLNHAVAGIRRVLEGTLFVSSSMTPADPAPSTSRRRRPAR